MPKKTFLNLKPEKQQFIRQCALEEFSQYGYFNTKISRIAKNSNIAVGSFYQYFEDINDLFMYCIDEMVQLKFQYIKQELQGCSSDDFQTILKAMYTGGLRFVHDYPQSFKLAKTFSSIVDTPVFSKIMKYYTQPEENDWLKPEFEKAVATNQIRSEISFELFMMLMSKINQTVVEYTSGYQNYDEENLEKVAQLATDILLNGITKE